MFVNEQITRRVDSCGRISIPKHLRAKFGIDVGEEVEFFTYEVNGRKFICLAAKEEENETRRLDSN